MPLFEDDPFGPVKDDRVSKGVPTPREVGTFHSESDVDSTVFAHHHTLGIRHQQASYGDHTHNGRDSKLISGTKGNNGVILTLESLSTTSYTDLATVGPAVTLDCGALVLVIFTAFLNATTAGIGASMSFVVSGANSVAASDNRRIAYFKEGAGTSGSRQSGAVLLTGLTPGTNTVTAKYRATGASASFDTRDITVIAF